MDDNASQTPDPDNASRRRSGRVAKAPSRFSPEPTNQNAASKRKRGQDDGDDVENEAPTSDDEMSDDAEESEEEHRGARSRKPAQRSRAKKSSTKKPKLNGTQPNVGGQSLGLPSRPKKSVRIDAGGKGTGIFVEIFGSGDSSDTVAQQWLEKYREDQSAAMTDLINCILQCIGCDQEVIEDDIRDEENIPNRVHDLQTVYQEQKAAEYPLIAKAKSTRSFRELLVGFFQSLVALLHETDVLYKDSALMDNLEAWLASMSSAGLRAFRHTATTIALAIQSGLVDVANVLDMRITNIEQQSKSAKSARNKSKSAEVQRALEEANGYRKLCSEAIQSFFDTIFVHRYRDVDPKIRVECVEALGYWIVHLETTFMEPGYLRYLGWMLSDTNGATRQEVLKQLSRVFRSNVNQLGHFIDRFRPRLIEIATRDSEVSVRVSAISVIEILRTAEMLEPSEIDSIGMLIFDNELRIRKAVVGFFVSCISDVYDTKVEEVGGKDTIDELDDVDEDDYESPRSQWLDVKSLAETLAIYDAQIQENQQDGIVVGADVAVDLLEAKAPDTSISLASQVLYEKVSEVRDWEMLAGYLLHDHTTSTKSRAKSKTKGPTGKAAFLKAVAPTPAEELILLNVLCSAVKMKLTQPSEADKSKKKVHRPDLAEQEEVAIALATVIPKLLSKYGAEPETAATVLRLEHFLNLDVFQQLRQDSSRYEKLLDEISTQFSRHDDKRVLSEATNAFLHARQYDDLEEMTDSKISSLWDLVIDSLRQSDKSCELSIRGNLTEAQLRELCTVLLKMSKLSSISDCVDVLEVEGKSDESSSSTIEIVSNIVHRGKYEPQEDEIDDLEDELVAFAIKACQFYFMWKIRGLVQRIGSGSGIPDAQLDRLSALKQSYRRHLIETLSSRAAIDQLRLYATGSLCDLHVAFTTLRPAIARFEMANAAASSQGSSAEKYKALIQEIEPGLVPELVSIFDGAEKQYAKKIRKDKTLNEPADDEDPMADDEEDDDDDEDESLSREERFAAELKAEKALCELTAKFVLAIMAKVLDNRGPQHGKLRRRILRNQTKLGNNFKEVVAYLDEEKMLRRNKKPAAAAKPAITPSTAGAAAAAATATAARPAAAAGEGIIATLEEDEEDDVFAEFEPEEGTVEDLRRRELLDEDIIEDDDDDTVQPLHNDADDGLGD